MKRSIAVFGGSFNPPGLHHRAVAEMLSAHFDEVLVVPCGPRPDKPVTNDVPPIYRAAMAEMTFRGLPEVRIELFDLEEGTFTRTWELEERFCEQGELWHVVGTDLVAGGGRGESVIQREWARGPEIWRRLNFAVVRRPGFDLDPADLPEHNRLFDLSAPGSSSNIRDRVFGRRPIDGLLSDEVAAYIQRHDLYRGMRPPLTTRFFLEEIRPLMVADPWNSRARALADKLGSVKTKEPNLIVVVGGDGTMLRAIRSEWRRRVPFYGLNTGHMGFLLNDRPPSDYLGEDLVLEQLPLLAVETEGADGATSTALAFNEAWVERATGQTAWLRVTVDGRQRLPKLIADGALIATAAGSTAYARAMGAHPVPLNTPVLLLVGSNVFNPSFFKPVVLPLDSTVELTTLDPQKRPLQGYIDGVSQGEVRSIRARVSRTAAVELAFDPGHDPAEKLARIQFPLDGWQ